jgi:serine/threonine protein kinase
MRTIRGTNYRLKSILGSGGFGSVYSAAVLPENEDIAIKMAADSLKSPALVNEFAMYATLAGARGFPAVFELGSENDRSFFSMELLGQSLSSLLRDSKPHFSLKTVLMLIEQMLSRVEFIHRKGILHRDIKPSNFLMGLGSHSNQVHLIDFGLAVRYSHDIGPTIIVGTPTFASINAQTGIAVSWRDDLESLGYVFLYLATGALPWQPIGDRNSSHTIATAKASISLSDLCAGLPDEFHRYMDSVSRLEGDDVPDYAGYRKMFRDLFTASGFTYDYKYDWTKTVRNQLSFDFPAPKLLPDREVKPVLSGLKDHSRPLSRGSTRTSPARLRSQSLKR